METIDGDAANEKEDSIIPQTTTTTTTEDASPDKNGVQTAFKDPQSPATMSATPSDEAIAEAISDVAVADKDAVPVADIKPIDAHLFTGKKCINIECKPGAGQTFVVASQFILSHYYVRPNKTPRKTDVYNPLYVCTVCHEAGLDDYHRYASALLAGKPLVQMPVRPPPSLVEILDSSDEEQDDASSKRRKGESGTDAAPAAAPTLAAEVLEMLEAEMESALSSTFERINLQKQCRWALDELQVQAARCQADMAENNARLAELQHAADRMHRSLYRTDSKGIENEPAVDADVTEESVIPPKGQLEWPKIVVNGRYYAVRKNILTAWPPCCVTEVLADGCYKVCFDHNKTMEKKIVTGRHIAYNIAPNVQLPHGSRVLAPINKQLNRSRFYPGIIAEPLTEQNRWRYLIFFDDGYAQYVAPNKVRLVCVASTEVWRDVHVESAQFIKDYLARFGSPRPTIRAKVNQRIDTEYHGHWLSAKVLRFDASLVQMQFEDDKRTEWIYRSSSRIWTVYLDEQKLNKYMSVEASRSRSSALSTGVGRPALPPLPVTMRRQTMVSHQRTAAAAAAPAALPLPQPPAPQLPEAEPGRKARKSTALPQPPPQSPSLAPVRALQAPPPQAPRAAPVVAEKRKQPPVKTLNNSTIYVDADFVEDMAGKMVYYTTKRNLGPRKFEVHVCGPSCLYTMTNNLSSYSLLAWPLLRGWERQMASNTKNTKTVVIYRAPCGRRLRNMLEVHYYLKTTKSTLNVDSFSFEADLHALAAYVVEKCFVFKTDLSEGREKMAVPCVNYYDDTEPPPCVYSEKRIPNAGVPLNLDADFLSCCDCEDDCLDKTRCQCARLTFEGVKTRNPNANPEKVGYEYRRLPDYVPTGIYECNVRCKCSSNCLNRVAQQPLQTKLQVFKTCNRGWGLRCLNDIPAGSFVCVYAGDLLTEQMANKAGDDYGDEYFAELDYIEVVESLKEGYESDVPPDANCDGDQSASSNPSDDEDDEMEKDDSEDEEFVAVKLTNMGARQTKYNTRRRNDVAEKQPKHNDDDSSGDLVERLAGTSGVAGAPAPSKRRRSVRKLFGRNESVYIMDAKKTGNIGRYFNHSCQPNLFVQNVFVDTHDLRFPWVAFFSLSYIRSGTELTWNYNYEVGSVPGKVLYCQCGAETCRGRLL